MWFEELTGFPEKSPAQVRAHMTLEGETLKSHGNGRVLRCGELETPSLLELRERVGRGGHPSGTLSVRELVADVQQLHTDQANAGAFFQVASQFNLLEMASPSVTPEEGVGIYENDHTQGPACAVAGGAGTIYRNYFVPVNGQVGQSAAAQLDCLADVGMALGNFDGRLWEMRNGYALVSRAGLVEIAERLRTLNEREIDALRQRLRIGIQWDTEVTLPGAGHTVSQAYCSALPVAYASHTSEASLWSGFAQLVLDAAYEATLCGAVLNAVQSGNNRVFLTLLGGGVFGNQIEWILRAIRRALTLHQRTDLDVIIVSYGSSNPFVQELVHRWPS